MSIEPLQICQHVLQSEYSERLGMKFASSIDEVRKGRLPVWRFVSEKDLVSELDPTGKGVAGLLLDPELGLLCYMLPFGAKTKLHNHIVRALGLRSQLSIERNYEPVVTEKVDSRGAWRVVIHWLVNADLRQKWIHQITDIRRETAFSEELSFDAIFFSAKNPREAFVRHGFPRLLLATREVFKKARYDEITQWMSADTLVSHAIATFADEFHKPEQRELANEIVTTVKRFREKPSTVVSISRPPSKPRLLRRIQIRDFRNLRNVRIDLGPKPVSTLIVHGPNGTGKSSLCEAISIGLFNSSFRYKTFADRESEKDVTSTDRAREYLERYIKPLDDPQSEPQIGIDTQSPSTPQLVAGDKIKEADLSMSGTILTQEASLEFTRMRALELGALVLRGYSDLADHVKQTVESRVAEANAGRQSFLRELSLPASITKIDTALERIARREVDKALPALPRAFIGWIARVKPLSGEGGVKLSQRWLAWGDDSSRSELARELARSNTHRTVIQATINDWIQRYNDLVLASTELFNSIAGKVEPIRQQLDEAPSQIISWGEWLEKHSAKPERMESLAIASEEAELTELQRKADLLIERGRDVSSHVEHLLREEAYVRETWSQRHQNECPTCGSNHESSGGIVKVVESLRKKTEAERATLRAEYNQLKEKISETRKRLIGLGQAQPPLNASQQETMTDVLRPFLFGAPLGESLSTKAKRDAVLEVIRSAKEMPSVPTAIDVELEAERITEKLIARFKEAVRIFEEPTNWKPVEERLTATLAEIVKNHLPRTLSRLWCEQVFNLTSAPWLLPDRPCIDPGTKRGEQTSTIRVRDRLARYILNQSEIHTLGLAWFFTRYLTRGRFFEACMLMDDPAHELDQTSFRDLCRLWETMLRLHRVYDRPFKLIVMLNQETRALEAARATAGVLSVLGWARHQDKGMQEISVIGEGFYPPQPSALFEEVGT